MCVCVGGGGSLCVSSPEIILQSMAHLVCSEAYQIQNYCSISSKENVYPNLIKIINVLKIRHIIMET